MTYYSLACVDSPCACRIPFGQHKGNPFTELSDGYLPLARAYVLSKEMDMRGPQRDALVAHIDREMARRQGYDGMADASVDELMQFLNARVSFHRQDGKWSFHVMTWPAKPSNYEVARLQELIRARPDKIEEWLNEDERRRLQRLQEQREADEAARAARKQERDPLGDEDVKGKYTEAGLVECWPWQGPVASDGRPHCLGGSSPGYFVWRATYGTSDGWEVTAKVCADRLCVNPFHRLTEAGRARVIALGIRAFYERGLQSSPGDTEL